MPTSPIQPYIIRYLMIYFPSTRLIDAQAWHYRERVTLCDGDDSRYRAVEPKTRPAPRIRQQLPLIRFRFSHKPLFQTAYYANPPMSGCPLSAAVRTAFAHSRRLPFRPANARIAATYSAASGRPVRRRVRRHDSRTRDRSGIGSRASATPRRSALVAR